jgi:predicted small lipoprotein YifL
LLSENKKQEEFKMKKLLTMLLALATVFSLCACGGEEYDNLDDATGNAEVEAEVEVEVEEPADGDVEDATTPVTEDETGNNDNTQTGEPIVLPSSDYYGLCEGNKNNNNDIDWFDIDISNITTETIQGKLRIYLGNYADFYADFEGKDAVQNGNLITYQCTYNNVGYFTSEGAGTMTYDLENNTITVENPICKVVTYCAAEIQEVALETGVWRGLVSRGDGNSYTLTLDITSMTSKAAGGHVTVHYQNELKADTEFAGRGILREDGTYFFDVLLDELWVIPGVGNAMDIRYEALRFVYDPTDGSIAVVYSPTGNLTKQ